MEVRRRKKMISLDTDKATDWRRSIVLAKVLTRTFWLFSRCPQIVTPSVFLLAAILSGVDSRAQAPSGDNKAGAPRASSSATIHWQGVPLGETLDRLKLLFNEPVFVDRRVDPNSRVTLDMSASSAEQALIGIADNCGLDVARLGKLLYLGPASAAGRLRPLASLRSRDIARLQPDVRKSLSSRHALSWARLSEPRQIAVTAVEQCGWRIVDGETIPHDLWAANNLPELTLAEELTVVLLGFDLTFEFAAADHAIRIVPLAPNVAPAPAQSVRKRATVKIPAPRPAGGTKQVYTLHVQEKPVGAVLHELANRLHWNLQIDEDAIRAAGKSLDQRVSFSVTNADQEKLLNALLEPAGLESREEGDQIRVIPQRYNAK
jgi:hypothetical protein